MAKLAILFSITGLFILGGAALAVMPGVLYDRLRPLLDRPALVWGGALVRLILGGAIIWAADAGNHPQVSTVLGVLILCSAPVLLLLGNAGIKAIVEWLIRQPQITSRALGVLVGCIGLWLLLTV